MVYIILTFINVIVLLIVISRISLKQLGNSVILTDSKISRKETLNLALRGGLALLLAFLLFYSRIQENDTVRTIIACLAAAYSAHILFPFINLALCKDAIGLYENGVIGYSGVMKYSSMKEYLIQENDHKDPDGLNMTVHCKSSFPLLSLEKHFDVDKQQAEEIGRYFRKKHSEISKVKSFSRKI